MGGLGACIWPSFSARILVPNPRTPTHMNSAATKSVSPEKQKALAAALSQIDKQFGKGSIMRLGDQPIEKVPVVSTGSILLDNALGIGGLPKGRVVEIYGPESSGKCLVKDTMVWTERGMETLEEVFGFFGQAASCASRVTDVSGSGFRLVNERASLESLAALTHNNRRPVVAVRTYSGREVEGTLNHPLRVLNTRGQIVWRNMGDIQVGNHLVVGAFGAEMSSGDKHSSLTQDEALLLGYLVAEGAMGLPNRTLFNNHDDEVIAEFKGLSELVLGYAPKGYPDSRDPMGKHVNFHINSKQIRERLRDEFGLKVAKSADKDIPHCVRIASNPVKKAFLSALFEGDAAVESASGGRSGYLSYASASKTLATQVQHMLLGFGIHASLRMKVVSGYSQKYWELYIGPAMARRFVDRVGFRSARRAAQVAQWDEANASSINEGVPFVADLVRDLRDSVVGDREFDKIAGDLFRRDMNLACSRERLSKIVAYFDRRAAELLPSAQAVLESLRLLSDEKYVFERVEVVEDRGEQPRST